MIAKSGPPPEMMIAIQVAVQIAVFGFIALMVWWGLSRLRKRWKKLAAELGLQYMPQGALMLPQLKGYFADIEITLTPRGNNRRSKGRGPQTVVTALIPCPLPTGLQLSREDFFFKLGKMFGGEEIELGDPQFDGTFKIYGEDVAGVKVLLGNPVVRNALLAFMVKYKNMAIDESHVTVVVEQYLDKPEAARVILTDVVNLVRALATAEGTLMPPLGP